MNMMLTLLEVVVMTEVKRESRVCQADFEIRSIKSSKKY
jgi:hypothetical protein